MKDFKNNKPKNDKRSITDNSDETKKLDILGSNRKGNSPAKVIFEVEKKEKPGFFAGLDEADDSPKKEVKKAPKKEKTKKEKIKKDKTKTPKAKKVKGEKKPSKGRWTISNTIIAVGSVLIAIPFIILGWILLNAYTATGTPILGDRFQNDLDPPITSEQIAQIERAVLDIEGVEDVDVFLKVATLRVYAHISQDLEAEEYIELAMLIYEEVIRILPVDIYFTILDNLARQYDLEIHVFTANMEFTADDFIYFILNQSALMLEPNIQLMSEPRDPELAEELRQAVIDRLNPPQPEDDDIVGETYEEEGGE